MMLDSLFELMKDTLLYVLFSLSHNALWLFLGILAASLIQVYADPDKLRQLLMRSSKISIGASVGFGALTPFCACGTMAIVVSMLTTVLPWGPIMAFLTSSPLMSPDFFIIVSGVVGTNFAVSLLIASIAIGLISGILTHHIEKNTSWLDNQARFKAPAQNLSASSPFEMASPAPAPTATPAKASPFEPAKLRQLLQVFIQLGLKQVVLFFAVFSAVGYWINAFVPEAWIMSLFGSQNLLAVPLAALLGIPLYVTGTSALPIINSLLAGGASGGVLLAFMITGPGTSVGVLAGIMTIMKKKAVGLYVLYLFTGAILAGYLYNLILAL